MKTWKKLPFKRESKAIEKVAATPPEKNPLVEMQREVDRIFDRFLKEPLGFWPFEMPALERWYGDFSPAKFTPTIDIADENKHISITAELPGMEEKDVKVTLKDEALVIRGEKRLEETKEDGGYYRTERSYGAFERVIPLPVSVDPEHVEATFTKGVLTVRLPKLPKEEKAKAPKQIPVTAV